MRLKLRCLAKPLFLAMIMGCLLAQIHAVDVMVVKSTVHLNGIPVIQVRTTASGLAPETRAGVAAALLGVLEPPVTVEARKGIGDWFVVAGNRQIITVTPEEAKQHGQSPQSLAESWANNIRKALNVPPLEVASHSIRVPLGQSREVALTGSQAKSAEVRTDAPKVVSVQKTPAGVSVTGIGAGYASVFVESGTIRKTFEVEVKPWAAVLDQPLEAEVTGAPATGDVVRGAIDYAIRTHVQQQPEARFSIDLPKPEALSATREKSYNVRVRVNAPAAIENVGYVKVTVRNRALDKTQDGELWYCNDPEIITGARNLFAASLKQDQPARLLYHHVNGSSTPLFVRIQAINESDRPVRLLVMPGDSNPHVDPVKAGIEAASQFMAGWMVGSGEILTIPPRSTIPISLRRLAPRETVSGLCSLRLLDDSPELLVRADSWPPFPLDERWRNAVASSTPWREVGANPINIFDTTSYRTSSLIFPNPYKIEEVNYKVGGRHAYVRIGQKPISRTDLALNLDGNFGVIYSIRASLQNTTDFPMDVEVVFEASAGYSGGLFLVNGSMQRTPLLLPKQESRIVKVHLKPGATHALSITTIPLSGSSYPATLTVRAVTTSDTVELGRH